MRLNGKFLLLMFFLFCIFILSYGYIYQTQKQHLTNLHYSYKEDFDKSFQKILDLSDTKYSNFVTIQHPKISLFFKAEFSS